MDSKISLRRAAELCAQEFTVEYPSGSEKIFIRTCTQTEIESAEREMTDKVLAIKEKYREGNAAYQSAVLWLEMQNDLTLLAFAIADEQIQIYDKASRLLPTLIPFDPTLYHTESDKEKAQKEWEQNKAERDRMMQEKVGEITSQRQEELLKLTREQLFERATRPYILNRINSEVSGLQEAYMIRDCIRDGEDHSKRYFETVEEIPPPGEVRTYLLVAIGSVETVKGFDIKNSQGRSVMQIGPAESTPDASAAPSTQDSQVSDSHKPRRRGGSRR